MNHALIQPYVFYGGRCDEALAHYQFALGAKVEMIMRYSESPQPAPPGMLAPNWDDKIMHCAFQVGESTILASDGCNESDGGSPRGFSLALTLKTEAEAEKAFNGLAQGGSIQMPLSKTFWSPLFGMLTDKFGVAWMVMVTPQQ